MLTVFAIPKPFRGRTATIQRNAITSWTLLRPRPQVILFGDEEGTAEVANDLGVQHVPDVARSESGTPLVNDLFDQAQRLAGNALLSYVNADIILMGDFMRAVARVMQRKQRFLMVGQRWDVEVESPLEFGADWEEALRHYVAQNGQLHSYTGIDYFVFPQGLWGDIPPFAIGRTVWDNWLIYRARSQGASVVDATQVVMAVHQNHDWFHIAGGKREAWEGQEAQRNRALADGHIFTLYDANWLLTPQRLAPALTRHHLARRWDSLPVFYPFLRAPHSFVHLLLYALKAPHRVPAAIARRLHWE